jgi:hypothetical protein
VPPDVDLAFFDPHDLTPERDREVTRRLVEEDATLPWEATNQAAVHRWYADEFGVEAEPLTSTADGVATWPETATAVAVRLHSDHRVEIVAPLGLADLLGLVHRRNPRRSTREQYLRRLADKRIRERWPRVTVADAES